MAGKLNVWGVLYSRREIVFPHTCVPSFLNGNETNFHVIDHLVEIFLTLFRVRGLWRGILIFAYSPDYTFDRRVKLNKSSRKIRESKFYRIMVQINMAKFRINLNFCSLKLIFVNIKSILNK